MLNRRALVAFFLLGLSSARALAQQVYPTRSVRILVGFAAGGGNDIIARILAERFHEIFGQPFVVENKPGASGMLAIETVKNAPADGLTLLVAPSSGMTVNPVVFKKIAYDPIKNFEPIGVAGFFSLVLAVHPSLPVKTVSELIAYAKARPGQVTCASAASSFQMAAELFADMAGVSFLNVNYRGSAPAITAVVANECMITFGDLAIALPQIQAGLMRPLGVSTAQRSPQLPDVPTIAESGLNGYEMVLWSGLFAPAGTPKPIVERLTKELRVVISEPKVQERLAALGVTPSQMGPEQLTALMTDELSKFGPIAIKAKMRVD